MAQRLEVVTLALRGAHLHMQRNVQWNRYSDCESRKKLRYLNNRHDDRVRTVLASDFSLRIGVTVDSKRYTIQVSLFPAHKNFCTAQ